MRRRTLSIFTVVFAATAAVSACTQDSTTAPAATTPLQAPSQVFFSKSLPAPTVVKPLQRRAQLHGSESIEKTIGVLGGTIVLPNAGLTVVVPPFAVASPTRFKITAKSGTDLAYEFEPHGVQFRVPLVVTQNLLVTQATPDLLSLGLSLGYVPDDSRATTVTELTDMGVLWSTVAVTSVWHFSGYIIATGRQ